MKRQFFGIILALVLIIGGGLFLLNTKSAYSDSMNFPMKVGEAYTITSGGTTEHVNDLTMPDSAGWM